MKYIVLPLTLLMWSCSTPEEVITREIDRIIRVDTVTIYLPGEPTFSPIVLDQYGFGENDKVQIRVDTFYKVKEVKVKSKPDTVKITVPDTITVEREKIVTKDESFIDMKLSEIILSIGGIMAVALIINLLRK